MSHPRDETLAAFVDGELTAEQHASVAAHLDSCDQCSEQIRLATGARVALGALEEVEVPPGTTRPVLKQADTREGPTAPHRGAVPRIYRLLATAAVAVLILGGIWIATDALRNDGGSAGSSAEMAAGGPAVPEADTRKLEELATHKAAELDRLRQGNLSSDQVAAGAGTTSGDIQAPSPSAVAAPNKDAAGTRYTSAQAITSPRVGRCLREAGALDQGGTLLEVLKDTYAGIPAYFAVLSEGPEPGAEPDRVTVWVFARQGCRILAFTTKYYPSMRPSPPTAFPSP